jgi:hypothetical protein
MNKFVCTQDHPALPHPEQTDIPIRKWNPVYAHPDAREFFVNTKDRDSFVLCPHCHQSQVVGWHLHDWDLETL